MPYSIYWQLTNNIIIYLDKGDCNFGEYGVLFKNWDTLQKLHLVRNWNVRQHQSKICQTYWIKENEMSIKMYDGQLMCERPMNEALQANVHEETYYSVFSFWLQYMTKIMEAVSCTYRSSKFCFPWIHVKQNVFFLSVPPEMCISWC